MTSCFRLFTALLLLTGCAPDLGASGDGAALADWPELPVDAAAPPPIGLTASGTVTGATESLTFTATLPSPLSGLQVMIVSCPDNPTGNCWPLVPRTPIQLDATGTTVNGSASVDWTPGLGRPENLIVQALVNYSGRIYRSNSIDIQIDPNRWFRAPPGTVPPGLTGTGWRIGDVAPNFSLVDQFGETVELYQFYGQAIVIDALGAWCPPCRDEAPAMEAFWAANRNNGYQYIGVMLEDINFQPPDQADLQAWVNAFGVTAPILQGTNAPMTLPLTGYPTYYFINPDMTVANVVEGAPGFDTSATYPFGDPLPWGTFAPSFETDCSDGVDEDLDGDPDCWDDDCFSAGLCDTVFETELLAPCFTGNSLNGVVDTYLVTLNGFGILFGDMVQPSTAFDMRLSMLDGALDPVLIGDDEWTCNAVPPVGAACPFTPLGPGTYLIAVDSDEICADNGVGEYVIGVQGGDATITLIDDDVADFIPF